MTEAVVDSSAVLAVVRREAGAEAAGPYMLGGVICAVNVIEVVSRLIDVGLGSERASEAVAMLGLRISTLDASVALDAGLLRRLTRPYGLSLGDRACIATARALGLPVLTADRVWAELDLGVEVVLLR